MKTLGVGITVDLRQIDFDISTPLAEQVNQLERSTTVQLMKGGGVGDGQTENWHFEEMRLDAEHCVAVAINSTITSNSSSEGFRFIDVEWLIENVDPLRNEEEISEDLCSQVLAKDVK